MLVCTQPLCGLGEPALAHVHEPLKMRPLIRHDVVAIATGPIRPSICVCGSSQTEGVLGHLGLNVPDLDEARRYYGGLMPLVGYELFFEAADEFAYMPAEAKRGTYLFFYPVSAARPYSRDDTVGIQHLAFAVRTRSAVRTAHEWATNEGSEVLHPPREFPEYPPPYFATFWLDPFGMMLEAVCHHDRD